MAKSPRNKQNDGVPRKSRKPHNPPPRPEPPEPPVTVDPGPAFPDPWYPDLAIHFYGLNWDLEHLPDGDMQWQLVAALRSALPPGDFLFAFDDHYPGVGVSASLSFGLWLSRWPDRQADAARRRGLLALRAPDKRASEAEALISSGFLHNFIVQNIPSSVGGMEGAPRLDLVASSVTTILPATLRVSVTYQTTLPLLGNVQPNCNTTLTFGAAGGNLTVTASNLDCGDFDLGRTLLPQIANVFMWPVLLLGGVALGGFAVHNLGSGRPALPALPNPTMPDLSQLLPREIPIDIQKLRLAYSRPDFTTRGTAPGMPVLHIPIGYAFEQRHPSLRLEGPALVDLPGGLRDVTYRAVAVDLAYPRFTWLLDGAVLPAEAGPTATLTLETEVLRVGTRRSFGVEVRAADAVVPSVQLSSRVTTVGRVTREAPDPRGPGRWT